MPEHDEPRNAESDDALNFIAKPERSGSRRRIVGITEKQWPRTIILATAATGYPHPGSK
jgi:hypothetical protein